MKILSKRNLIAFVIMIALCAVSFSILSFTLADDENGSGANGGGTPTASVVEGKSIIDYIIDNSYVTEDDNDNIYHIYEIHSGSPSSLGSMVTSDKFESLVLNGNKTSKQTKDMNPKKIEYLEDDLNADEETMIARIAKADLIYISEDPNSQFSLSNDIKSENVKNALARYATNDEKPIIFDSHTLTNSVNKIKNNYSYVASKFFLPEGISYDTYEWDSSKSVPEVMNPSDTVFTPMDGDSRSEKWIKVTKGSTEERVARVLTISGGTTNALTEKFKTSMTTAYSTSGITAVVDPADPSVDNTNYSAANTFVVSNTDPVWRYGYFGNSDRPSAFRFDTIAANTDLTTIDFSIYDFVIIESSCGTVDLSSESSSALLGAMYNDTYIMYDASIANTIDNGSVIKLDAVNIKYVYDKLVDATDTAMYKYVLVCARNIMDYYSSCSTAKGVKDIADIINAGSFRGIKGGGSDDASSVYTVLEIEPCYPVNEDLALALKPVRSWTNPVTNKSFQESSRRDKMETDQYSNDGFYYIRTDGVSSDTTDEISFGDNMSLTSLLAGDDGAKLSDYIKDTNKDNVKDYYAWSVSKAKIAHATGRSYDKVNVVHMSSAEFNASRKTLLDNYDAIFIGGDNSAIKKDNAWNTNVNLNGNYYRMYGHNGDTYPFPNINDKVGQYGVFSGNDITYSKLTELQKYAEKMPVIIDSKLTEAYVNEYNNQNKHELDPESNMYAFIKGITNFDSNGNLSTGKTNLLVNFDFNYTNRTANKGGQYGKTYGGYATVFKGLDTVDYLGKPIVLDQTKTVDETDLRIALSSSRPLIAVTKMPTIYNDTEKSTWIDYDEIGGKLKWHVDVTTNASTATVKLLVDNNGDGKFKEADNEVKATADGLSVDLEYPIAQSYFGVVYWKVVAETSNGLSCSTVNCCKIKRKDQPKMVVDLLEIMPSKLESGEEYGTSENSRERMYSSLYFCTECQTAKTILKNNRSVSTGKFKAGVLGGENTFSNELSGDAADAGIAPVSTSLVNVMKQYDPSYSYDSHVLGTHTHQFGIVKYYDNYTVGGLNGIDNLNTNWFDVVRDDYDVNTDIVYAHEFDEMVAAVNNVYAGKTSDEIKKLVESTQINDGFAGYKERANISKKNYDAIRDLLNGKYSTVTGTAGSYAVTVNLDKFKTNNPDLYSIMTAQGIDDDRIIEYAKSSYNIDNYLSNKKADIVSATSKTDASSAELTSEVERELDSEIDRDKRNYYDMIAMWNDFSARDQDCGFSEFIGYYDDWRDAKILENFFWKQYKQNQLYAGVDYKTGKVDIYKTYNCILLGAAEKFAGDDLSYDSCDALASYIKQDGNLILMHDSLTSEKGATDRMTERLSSLFGMNARHYSKLKDKKLIDNDATISIDGVEAGSVELKSGTLKKTVSATQKISPITDVKPVEFTVGDKKDKITDLTNSNGELIKNFDVALTKKTISAGTLRLYFAQDNNELSNSGGNIYVDIPLDASKAIIKFNRNDWLSFKDIKVETEKYSGGTEPHDIEIVNQGNTSCAIAYGDYRNMITTINQGSSYNLSTVANVDLYFGYSHDLTKFSVPTNATEVNIEFDTSWGNLGNKSMNVVKTTTDSGQHDLKINLVRNIVNPNDPSGIVLSLNGTNSSNYLANNIQGGETFTVDNPVYLKTTDPEYEYTVDSITSSTEVVSGDEPQTFTFTVKDDSGNPISGERVEYVVNGVKGTTSTKADGKTSFVRDVYNVDGYEIKTVDSKDVPESDPYTDDQTLNVIVYGPDGTTVLPGRNVTVKAGTNSPKDELSDASGQAKFVFSNYKEADPTNPTEELDSGFSSDKYRLSKITNNDSSNLSRRMLSYKGYFMTAGEGGAGQLPSRAYDFSTFRFSSIFAAQEEYTNGGYGLGTKDMRKMINEAEATMSCDKAQKNNQGIITLYPFGIGDTMKVSATLPGSYACDVEDDDLVVYYSLIGGTTGTGSSFYAADPMDGANNYFLYQKGSITYSGAGHSLITGYGRNNNDERKLFINIILNAAKKSSDGPDLTLHDLGTDGKKNDEVIPIVSDDCNYYTTIESVSDFKGFDMLPKIAETSSLGHVKIYYDINHTANKNDDGYYSFDGDDVLIFDSDRLDSGEKATSVLENIAKSMDENTKPSGTGVNKGMQIINATDSAGNDLSHAAIRLEESYFDPGVGKKYAYIVVQVTDASGTPMSKVLRIQYKPELQDLN